MDNIYLYWIDLSKLKWNKSCLQGIATTSQSTPNLVYADFLNTSVLLILIANNVCSVQLFHLFEKWIWYVFEQSFCSQAPPI